MLRNLVCQALLLAITLAAVVGKHERLMERAAELLGPRLRMLQRLLAAVLATVALAVLSDGIVALAGEHVPWLRQLLLLRCDDQPPTIRIPQRVDSAMTSYS